MNYKTKWIGSNAIVSFKGVISFDYINDANGEIYGDARFDTMDFLIFDFQEVEKFNITKEEISIISKLDKGSSRWNKNLKLAFIVSDNNKNFKDLTLYYINLMNDNDWKILIFNNLEEALDWCLNG